MPCSLCLLHLGNLARVSDPHRSKATYKDSNYQRDIETRSAARGFTGNYTAIKQSTCSYADIYTVHRARAVLRLLRYYTRERVPRVCGDVRCLGTSCGAGGAAQRATVKTQHRGINEELFLSVDHLCAVWNPRSLPSAPVNTQAGAPRVPPRDGERSLGLSEKRVITDTEKKERRSSLLDQTLISHRVNRGRWTRCNSGSCPPEAAFEHRLRNSGETSPSHFEDLRQNRPINVSLDPWAAKALMGVSLMGVSLMGVSLMGVSLMGVSFWGQSIPGCIAAKRQDQNVQCPLHVAPC